MGQKSTFTFTIFAMNFATLTESQQKYLHNIYTFHYCHIYVCQMIIGLILLYWQNPLIAQSIAFFWWKLAYFFVVIHIDYLFYLFVALLSCENLVSLKSVLHFPAELCLKICPRPKPNWEFNKKAGKRLVSIACNESK